MTDFSEVFDNLWWSVMGKIEQYEPHEILVEAYTDGWKPVQSIQQIFIEQLLCSGLSARSSETSKSMPV